MANVAREIATEGIPREKVVATYKVIRDIFRDNSDYSMEHVLTKVVGIGTKSFYNYIYAGKYSGKVPITTVAKLSEYFNMPSDVFACKSELNDEDIIKMTEKVRNEFKILKPKKVIEMTTKNAEVKKESDIKFLIKQLTINLANENDYFKLEELVVALNICLEVAKARLSILERIENMG